MAGLAAFKQAGVQPRWLIIDDGWQVGLELRCELVICGRGSIC